MENDNRKKKFFLTAVASGQTCFEAGECRESHHIQGDAAADQVQCLENCKQQAGQNIEK